MKIVDGWLDEAIEIDCLENTSSRNGRAIKFVVQHGTAGGSSAEDIGNFYRSTIGGNNPVSTHFIVGKDGHIVQCVPLTLAAWANGVLETGHAAFISDAFNPNEDTASIEYVKNQLDANGVPDNSDELTDAQKLAGFRLNKCICETYNIPKRAGDANGGIIAHHDIDPVNRSRCPGSFPWDELFSYLNGETTMASIDITTTGVSNYFEGSGDVWKCKKTGFFIGHGILGFYKKFGGDALCGITYLGLPTSNERAVQGHPGVVEQDFERATARYDTGHALDNPPKSGDVYLIHVEQNPLVTKALAQVADLQKQIAALKQPAPANLVQINTLAKQNADNDALIIKLSQAQ
jgi:N-acetyl-anhydromuramyl-L-alanine amidase AmpD